MVAAQGGRFVAVDVFEGAVLFGGEGGEGEGVDHGAVHDAVGLLDAGAVVVDGLVEDGGFPGLDAAETPAGLGELVDEIAFDRGLGGQSLEVFAFEADVEVAILGGEDDVAHSGHAVPDGVLRGGGLAGVRGRAAGFGAIAARDRGALFGGEGVFRAGHGLPV